MIGRLFPATAVLALVLLHGVGAQAATLPTVSLKASASTVAPGTTVTLRGQVSGPSVGAPLRLQKHVSNRWVSVRSSKVRPGRAFSFAVKVTGGTAKYRVKVIATSRLRTAVSRTVTLRAVTDQPTSSELDSIRSLILQKTNEYRAQNGLAPLHAKAELTTVAQRWTEHMAAANDFNHNPNIGTQYPAGWTRWGENIAYGATPDEVVSWWINSPPHRANLLGDFNVIGIGFARGGPSGTTTYFTQDFGKY